MTNTTRTILLIEDEDKLVHLMQDYLHQAGFNTHHIDHGDQVEDWLKDNTPSLIILDIMLPGKDGLTLCKEIRRSSDIPIIMVTARVEEIDRLLGLEFGADDYLCKPFSIRELVARVKSVLRRFGTTGTSERAINSALILNNNQYLATINGQSLDLTAIEFNLLSLLFKNPGRIYSRSQLIDQIYKDERVVSERTVDSHVKKLRKKMTSIDPQHNHIHSVYSVGYKYELSIG